MSDTLPKSTASSSTDPIISLRSESILETDLKDLRERNQYLENTRRAIFNVLEDVADSEKELGAKTVELEKFRQAVDASFDHVVITDPDGRVFYANHATELMTGYSKEEIIGQTPALWGGQMSHEFYETFWRTIKIEKNGYAGELTNRRKDGTKYLSSLRVAPIFDEDGEIKFFVGIERDITEERKSQLKIVRHAAELEKANVHIEEQKDRAESILRFLKSIGEGVFATDNAERVIFMNEASELMVGQSFSNCQNQPYDKIVSFVHKGHDGSELFDIVGLTLRERRTISFPQNTFLVREDKEIPISGTCSLIRDEEQKSIGTITVFQDITKKHELDQMKDSFLSVAAHQLRTPLGSMRWNMELLLGGDLGRLPKAAKDAVAQIYENSQRMIVLVNDLLNVSRINQHKGKEEFRLVDLGGMLDDVIRGMHPEGKRRGVDLKFEGIRHALPLVLVPPKHFYEAFQNLVSNAIKYNHEGGMVRVRLSEEKDALEVQISDTGIGIPKDDQTKIFSKFFRAANAVLKETEGSGLGLSVVKSYLEEAGATVRFESKEAHGTTFFVRVPLPKDRPKTK